MLFNKELTVPDDLSERQIKNRSKDKAANPFTIKEKIAKDKKKIEKLEQDWAPCIETFSEIDSKSIAATTGYYGMKAKVCFEPICFELLCYITLFCYSQQTR
jgi:hypothetical protein